MWLENNNIAENEEKKEFPVKQESLKYFLVGEIGYLWPDISVAVWEFYVRHSCN